MAVEPAYRIKNMMPGMIMLWHGTVASIPSGWHLCDGTMGTPDLGVRVVRGARAIDTPGVIGGASEHSHDFTADGHFHQLIGSGYVQVGSDFHKNTSVVNATGTTDGGYSWPPFIILCYIMKL